MASVNGLPKLEGKEGGWIRCLSDGHPASYYLPWHSVHYYLLCNPARRKLRIVEEHSTGYRRQVEFKMAMYEEAHDIYFHLAELNMNANAKRWSIW